MRNIYTRYHICLMRIKSRRVSLERRFDVKYSSCRYHRYCCLPHTCILVIVQNITTLLLLLCIWCIVSQLQLCLKRNRLKVRSYRRYGEHVEKMFVFQGLFCSRCCTRRNLGFNVENSHPDQKQLTRRYAFDLDIEETHGQPGSYRARPVNADDGLDDIRWIRVLGGEKLPAASYTCLLYTSPSPRDLSTSRMPSSA